MAEAQEEDFSQLPLPERFGHKNWKVRKEGYEAAAKEFERTPDELDPAFKPFLLDPGLWKSAAADSNVAAQQEGLAALCAFLKYGGQQAAIKSRGHTVQPIFEKGLPSTRPAAKANALEALLLYVELDKSEPVIEELLSALTHKQPKVIAATLSAITAIFHNFGFKVVDYKGVLKALPKVFGHADKNVRAEASNLTVELYRWLKEAMKAVFWNDLKPVQQQDLDKLFEKVKDEPAPKQERFTRAQQAAMAAAEDSKGHDVGGVGIAVEAEEEEFVEVDVFDLAEPIDVFSKIPQDFQENMASTKWKDRKEALDALFNVLNTPRIKDGPFDDVVRILAKCMKDANIAVVTVAANCVEKLAVGLRKSFAKYRSTIMSPMMERFKEKKVSVAEALGAGLDAVFDFTSLTDCLEETIGFLANKNPQVKAETIKFLVRCLRTTRVVPEKSEIKAMADAAIRLLTESTEALRSGGAEILGTIMKIVGERAMGPYLEGLDDIRKTKIKECFDAAEVKAKEKPKPVAPPAKATGITAVGKKVATGVKKPGIKKPAPAAAPVAEEVVPLQPKPTAKSLPKPGGLSKPVSVYAQRPSSGLKSSGLKRPGGTGAVVSSPQRRVISPPVSIGSEEDSVAPSPARFGPGRGGLAGRPLNKPPAPSAQPDVTLSTASHGLSAIERAELEELRSEKDRLLALTDSLRSSNAKLTAEISELQNQNAQLIEDHTRDVLQIKAKETQLVRVRSECDVLRSEVENAHREGDRYKREISRLGRENLERERETMVTPRDDSISSRSENGIYADAQAETSRPTSALGRTGSSAVPTRPPTGGRPQGYMMTSPSEEKENANDSLFGARRKISPPVANLPGGGRASPVRRPDVSRTTTAGSEVTEPAENWKRAAEVTSQLKARIEQMKARQGLSRP